MEMITGIGTHAIMYGINIKREREGLWHSTEQQNSTHTARGLAQSTHTARGLAPCTEHAQVARAASIPHCRASDLSSIFVDPIQ